MKNTKAKFSNKTKQIILDRDVCCIICGKPGTDCHHVYFGMESEYWKDRNDANKGVLLCREDHNMAHSCSSWEWVRHECIQYAESL